MLGDMSTARHTRKVQAWQVVVVAAAAGGMGWGIRGQYGHETGAMMAGLLGGLVRVGHGDWRVHDLRADRGPDP